MCSPGLSDVFSSFLTHFLSHHYLHTQNVPHSTMLNAQDNAQIHKIKIHNAQTHKYTMHIYTIHFIFVWPVSAVQILHAQNFFNLTIFIFKDYTVCYRRYFSVPPFFVDLISFSFLQVWIDYRRIPDAVKTLTYIQFGGFCSKILSPKHHNSSKSFSQ